MSRVLVERESSMLGKLAWPHAPKGQSYPREPLPMEQSPGPQAERQKAVRDLQVTSPEQERLWLGRLACNFLPHRTFSAQDILLRSLSKT